MEEDTPVLKKKKKGKSELSLHTVVFLFRIGCNGPNFVCYLSVDSWIVCATLLIFCFNLPAFFRFCTIIVEQAGSVEKSPMARSF